MTPEVPQCASVGERQAAPRRTFVLSDAHGYPEVIEEALDHGGFRPGEDAFVYAGDLLDRGPDPEGCIELVQRHATEILVGNHEMAVLLDFDMWGSDWDSRRLRPLLLDMVLNAASDTRWKAATCNQGGLITHGGVSARYQDWRACLVARSTAGVGKFWCWLDLVAR